MVDLQLWLQRLDLLSALDILLVALVFFLLLTLYLTLRERYAWSAVTAAIGLMTKIVPILIVPIALQRVKSWR